MLPAAFLAAASVPNAALAQSGSLNPDASQDDLDPLDSKLERAQWKGLARGSASQFPSWLFRWTRGCSPRGWSMGFPIAML